MKQGLSHMAGIDRVWRASRRAVGGAVLSMSLVFALAIGVSTALLPAEASASSSASKSKASAKPKKGAQEGSRARSGASASARNRGASSRASASPGARASRSAAIARSPGSSAGARSARSGRANRPVRAALPPAPPRLSYGQLAGLHATDDPLDLASSVALVVDQDTREVLFSKNPGAILPIASLTKLMTALVVAEAEQSLDDTLTITRDDIDTEKGSSSRLSVGTQLTRGEALHLALMSSENRAANALGRYYPGGMRAFVQAMNAKAQLLGMADSEFVEPTGLSSRNRSSAHDLAQLVQAAYAHRIIRELSTAPSYELAVANRQLAFRNTNGLVHSPNWTIGLQKTGYISEAGRCLVMQVQTAGRKVIMVFLDSAGRHSRLGDAERVRRWVNESLATSDARLTASGATTLQ